MQHALALLEAREPAEHGLAHFVHEVVVKRLERGEPPVAARAGLGHLHE